MVVSSRHLSVHTELSWELGQRVRGSIQNVLDSRSPHPHFTMSQVLTLLLFIQFIIWKTLCFTYIFSLNPLVYSLKRFPPSPLENKWVPNMNGLPKVKQVVSGQARIELWFVSFHFIPKHLTVLLFCLFLLMLYWLVSFRNFEKMELLWHSKIESLLMATTYEYYSLLNIKKNVPGLKNTKFIRLIPSSHHPIL